MIDVKTIAKMFHIRTELICNIHNDFIIGFLCQSIGRELHFLADKTRETEIVDDRIIFCFLMYHCTDLTYKKIGLKLGGRDHSTIIHNCKRFEVLYEVDKAFRDKADCVIEKFYKYMVKEFSNKREVVS